MSAEVTQALVQLAVRLLLSAGGVASITFVAHKVIPGNPTTVAFAYLLFVLIVASTWGFVEACLSSILATLAFNFFFLPPVGTFTIADPQNWVALFSFLATALIASRLSDKAKQKARYAVERQQDVERLYTFSRAILLLDNSAPLAKQLVQKLAEVFGLSAAILYDRHSDESYRAGPSDFEGLDEQLREAALNGTTFSDLQPLPWPGASVKPQLVSGQDGPWRRPVAGGRGSEGSRGVENNRGPKQHRVVTAVRLGSEPIASLALLGAQMPDSVLQGIATLIAIGLERARAQDLSHQVEAARQSERLRTTLIDAMAHEFKTPLTSIKAATTSLLADPNQSLDSRMELLKIADEESDRLKDLVDNAADMARLDIAQIDIHSELLDIGQIVREVISSMRVRIDDRHVDIDSQELLPSVALDRRLVKLAIKQLVDNSLKYSPQDTPVTVQVARGDGSVILEVTNHGVAIPLEEQDRIFERFYRSPSVERQIPGSGLGLSIAHAIARAHHGDLTLTSRPGETTFRMTLPIDHKGKQS